MLKWQKCCSDPNSNAHRRLCLLKSVLGENVSHSSDYSHLSRPFGFLEYLPLAASCLSFISFSYNLGRVALQLVLVSKGPYTYFTIYFKLLFKTMLKHIMNKMQNLCKLPPIKTMNFGLDSISFRGSFLWDTLDDSITREKTLACFQKMIGK